MAGYKTRPGVVLTEIAGEYVLVAAKALSGVCPYVTLINESSAFLWRKLEQGANLEQLQAAVSAEYEVEDPAAVQSAIRDFIRHMNELNYLLTDETEERK